MVRDNRHDSVHIFGAICPARGIGTAIIIPGVNAEAMNERLAEISTQVAAGVHCLLVCDGAGWHQQGEQLDCTGQHHTAVLAALCARAEPDGKHLGLSARQQIKQHGL
jgi:hypothetical protein